MHPASSFLALAPLVYIKPPSFPLPPPFLKYTSHRPLVSAKVLSWIKRGWDCVGGSRSPCFSSLIPPPPFTPTLTLAHSRLLLLMKERKENFLHMYCTEHGVEGRTVYSMVPLFFYFLLSDSAEGRKMGGGNGVSHSAGLHGSSKERTRETDFWSA